MCHASLSDACGCLPFRFPKRVRVLNYGAAKEFVSNEPRDAVMRRYRMTPEQITEDVLKVL